MSLAVALALACAALIAALGFNLWWQSRRGPRRAAVTSAAPERSEPREPTLDEPVADAAAAPGEGGEPADDALPPDQALPAEAMRAALRRQTARLDALIDGIAALALESPVSGELALTHLPPTRRAGGKPFMVEGLNAETGEWEAPAAGARYREFQAGVQLANRTGALNEIEYSEFVQKVQAFADAIGALPDFPDMLDVVARARELDAFAGEHDAHLAVHLRPKGVAWSVGYIQQQAAREGFVPGLVAGRLVLPAAEEGAPPILTLAFDGQAALAEDPNQAAVRDLVLAFDVPQTAPELEPFAGWQAAAAALARAMEAAVVDDQGRELGPHAFAAIGSELESLYRALEARDLGAGTAAARRLFS